VAHKETKSPRWSLVAVFVAVLLVATVFWAVDRSGSSNTRSDRGGTAAAVASEATSPVQEYLQLVGTAGTAADVDDKFMADGLRTLAGAIGTLNLGTPDLQVDLRVAAEHILLNPASSATTEIVRNCLISAADAIETGGQDESDNNLTRLAESVHPEMPLIDQRATVQMFFQASAEAIKRITPASG
jgi:hypothetical protein